MPDFSMCAAPGCKMARECERHENSGTLPSKWQSWSAFKPYGNGLGCDYFVPSRRAALAAQEQG
jgi:hypothetical protein